MAPATIAQNAGAQGTAGAFSDDDSSFAQPAFEALAVRGIFDGTECGEGRICPNQSLQRSTMAVWLTRALEYGEPPEIDSSRFADVDASIWWADHVERFAELEVTKGCASEPLRFCPDQPVTRAQMAAFLVRALRLPDAPSGGFTDTAGNFATNNIDALAAAGITAGCSSEPLRFCPDQPVTRAQMATFLARALGLVASSAPALSPQEVYASVSPSIAYIETDTSNGSGILIPGDYVLTNHHVVWPFDVATVVFPDGTEYIDVPVAATNPWADIAVLGPLETDKRPLPLANGEDLPPGSDLFLIGYPAEYEFAPEPTITRGLLSRVRHWDGYDMTLLQTDAAIAGGQSGGALVDDRGRVVGVSTWSWTPSSTDATFGVATSATDDADIIDLMLTDTGYSFSFTERIDAESDPSRDWDFELRGWWDLATFVLAEPAESISLEAEGSGDPSIWLADEFDGFCCFDAEGVIVASGSAEIIDKTYFVQVDQSSASPGTHTLTSSVDLLPYYDEDGIMLIAEDETSGGNAGVFDYAGDGDVYDVQLQRGDTVVIWTDSIQTDTSLTLYGSGSNSVADDDNSGPRGALGHSGNAEITFEAPATGTYYLVVSQVSEWRGGNYIVFAEILS